MEYKMDILERKKETRSSAFIFYYMMLAVIIFHLLTFAIEIYLKEPEEIYFVAFTIKKTRPVNNGCWF